MQQLDWDLRKRMPTRIGFSPRLHLPAERMNSMQLRSERVEKGRSSGANSMGKQGCSLLQLSRHAIPLLKRLKLIAITV